MHMHGDSLTKFNYEKIINLLNKIKKIFVCESDIV